MAAAPARREDDPRQRSKAAIERRLKGTDWPRKKRKKRPYPNMKTRPDAY